MIHLKWRVHPISPAALVQASCPHWGALSACRKRRILVTGPLPLTFEGDVWSFISFLQPCSTWLFCFLGSRLSLVSLSVSQGLCMLWLQYVCSTSPTITRAWLGSVKVKDRCWPLFSTWQSLPLQSLSDYQSRSKGPAVLNGACSAAFLLSSMYRRTTSLLKYIYIYMPLLV